MKKLIVLIAAGVVALALASGALHLDHVGRTYGFSVGTDTHYCSVETTGVSCEAAR